MSDFGNYPPGSQTKISADPRLRGALRKTLFGVGVWDERMDIANAFVCVSLHLESRSQKALEKQCLFRGSLRFQHVFLVSSKRLYAIHVT